MHECYYGNVGQNMSSKNDTGVKSTILTKFFPLLLKNPSLASFQMTQNLDLKHFGVKYSCTLTPVKQKHILNKSLHCVIINNE